MKDTSGANYTGSTLEKFIHDRLIERGYQFIDGRLLTWFSNFQSLPWLTF